MAQAVHAGCRKAKACEALELSLRTVQRWEGGAIEDRRRGSRAAPTNRLSEDERAGVLAVLNAPAYRDKSPNQIVPLLADRGAYVASEATMYRILKQHKQLAHRQGSAPARRYEALEHTASGPNQVWSWDIVRHEALSNRVEVKGHRAPAVAAAECKLGAA